VPWREWWSCLRITGDLEAEEPIVGHNGELLNDAELPGDIENVLCNTKEDLRKANEKIAMLQECLKFTNEAAEAINAKYKEANTILQKSEEEKLFFMC